MTSSVPLIQRGSGNTTSRYYSRDGNDDDTDPHDARCSSRDGNDDDTDPHDARCSSRDGNDDDTDPHDALPLNQALKQYSRAACWVLGLSTVVILWGYDLAVVGAVSSMDPFQRDFGVLDKIEDGEEKWIIPAIWLALWQAFPSVGQLGGALTAGPLMDRIGRKKCILIGTVLVTISVLIEVLANRASSLTGKRAVFLAGKIIQGLATALMKITTLTWISETVPTCLRGASMSVIPAANLLGQFLGAIIVFGLNSLTTDLGYLIALGMQWIFSIAPFVVAFLLPESPAYLVRGHRIDEAKHSIDRLFSPKNDCNAILERLRVSVDEEERKSEGINYMQCFKGTDLRRTNIIIFANLLPALFGLPLLSSASYFLQQLGMKNSMSLMFLIIGIIVGFIGNLGSAWTSSSMSRRPLTIVTLLISAVFWAAMGITGCISSDKIVSWISAAFLMIIIFTCGLGVWSTSYAIMSETSSLRLRANSQAIGGVAAYLSSIFTNFVLPYLYNPDAANLKAKTGFFFMATSAIGAVVTWAVVPEMKGRSALDIDSLFEEKVSARDSAKWRSGRNVD
jgi:MFS transporter, SP family, general alpha glucoside:H+ symporter